MDLLKNAPLYRKFIKDILSNKKTIEEVDSCLLNHECSALISTTMPTKVKDPGRFTIPCSIGNIFFDSPLADLGASVSVMPISVYRNLGLEGMKSTEIVLHLADGSSKKPYGVVENVPVKVNKFYIPCDFVVMDVSGNMNSPLIFGRPFLATAKARIDVASGTLSLEICDEIVGVQSMAKVEVVACERVKVKPLEMEETAKRMTGLEPNDKVMPSNAAKLTKKRLKRLCGPPSSSTFGAQFEGSLSKGSSGLSKPKNLREKNQGTSKAIMGAVVLASKNPD